MDLICFIFECFGVLANTIYPHHLLHIHFKIFAEIRTQIFDLMQNIHFRAHIFILANICFKIICLEEKIRKTLCEFHFQANICLQIFAYQLIFATHCFKLFRKPFSSLRPQLIFGSVAILSIFAYQLIFATHCFKLFWKPFSSLRLN
jgi:hypothetical protein